MIAINNESNGCKNGLLNGVMKTINAQSNFTISKMRNLFYVTMKTMKDSKVIFKQISVELVKYDKYPLYFFAIKIRQISFFMIYFKYQIIHLKLIKGCGNRKINAFREIEILAISFYY